MKTIVALVDFSDLTFKVLKQAHTLAKAFDSEVVILHVPPKQPVVVDIGIASPTVYKDPSPKALQEDYQMLLEMRDSLVKFGVKARVMQLNSTTTNQVLEETTKLGADLLILGSHHHSTIYQLFVGSVTDDILKRSHCPVLVVPA